MQSVSNKAPPNQLAYDYIRSLVHQHAAIVINKDQDYLIDSRVEQVLTSQGISSFDELVSLLDNNPFGQLHQCVVTAFTVKETSFFRDSHVFDVLKRQILPQLFQKKTAEKKINIWCAACSYGQEAYSLAMLIHEMLMKYHHWSVELIASDISSQALEKAQQGIYSNLEVQRGLKPWLQKKYFTQTPEGWHVHDEIRRMVTFKQINIADSWPTLSCMDIVLMRNLLIYFDAEAKKRVLNRIAKIIHPDGYLFVGAAETIIDLDSPFQLISPNNIVYYQLDKTKGVKKNNVTYSNY